MYQQPLRVYAWDVDNRLYFWRALYDLGITELYFEVENRMGNMFLMVLGVIRTVSSPSSFLFDFFFFFFVDFLFSVAFSRKKSSFFFLHFFFSTFFSHLLFFKKKSQFFFLHFFSGYVNSTMAAVLSAGEGQQCPMYFLPQANPSLVDKQTILSRNKCSSWTSCVFWAFGLVLASVWCAHARIIYQIPLWVIYLFGRTEDGICYLFFFRVLFVPPSTRHVCAWFGFFSRSISCSS